PVDRVEELLDRRTGLGEVVGDDELDARAEGPPGGGLQPEGGSRLGLLLSPRGRHPFRVPDQPCCCGGGPSWPRWRPPGPPGPPGARGPGVSRPVAVESLPTWTTAWLPSASVTCDS